MYNYAIYESQMDIKINKSKYRNLSNMQAVLT